MNELIAKINDLSAALVADAELQAEKRKQSSRYSCPQSFFGIGKSVERIQKSFFGRIKKIISQSNTCSKRGCIYQEPDNWYSLSCFVSFQFYRLILRK